MRRTVAFGPRLATVAMLTAMASASPSGAHAQALTSAENEAAAQSLFNEGKALMSAERVAEACPKFLASYRFDKRVGTLLNLADCYEKNGQTASAWARFVEASTLARRANQQERYDFAREHAAALAPKLLRISVAVATKVDGLEVLKDGSPMDASVLGVAVPIDPGKHEIVARAPLKKPWSKTVTLTTETKQTDVIVPPLADDPEAIAKAKAAAQANGHEPRFWSAQRVVGAGTVVVGLAGLGLGTAFGLSASAKWSSAKGPSHCDASGCDATGIGEARDAANAGTISTVAFVAGGVLVAGGVVMFLTGGPTKPKESIVLAPSAGNGGASVWLRGTF